MVESKQHGGASSGSTSASARSDGGGITRAEGGRARGRGTGDSGADAAAAGDSLRTTAVVFSQDRVHVHHQRSKSISGRLRLVQEGRDSIVFLDWLPTSTAGETSAPPAGDSAHDERAVSAGRARSMYAVHPIPLSEVRAVRRYTPQFMLHHVVISLHNGVALPPLYFHAGGVRNFFSKLREHVTLSRSPADPSLYLFNDLADPLGRSLSSLDLVPGPSMQPRGLPDTSNAGHSTILGGGAVPDGRNGIQSMLVNMGRIARDTTASFFADSLPAEVAGPSALVDDGPPLSDSRFSGTLGDREAAEAKRRVASSDLVEEAAEEEDDEEGTVQQHQQLSRNSSGGDVQGGRSSGGIAAAPANPDADGADPSTSQPPPREAAKDAAALTGEASSSSSSGPALLERGREASSVGDFELVDDADDSLPSMDMPSWKRARPPPLGADELASFYDGTTGRLLDEACLRERIFHSGVEPGLRKEVWPFLLDLHPPKSTAAERSALREKRKKEYDVLRGQWESMTALQSARFSKFRDRRNRIDKDVVRTDRTHPHFAEDDSEAVAQMRRILTTYVFYNFDLGYCQGMSDLLAPILVVMEDEVEAFWGFAALMERAEANFHHDQAGMHAQLNAIRRMIEALDPAVHAHLERADCTNYFFLFRMILVHFKREFEFPEVLRLWEALWSNHHGRHFHLWVAAAILERHRATLLDPHVDIDTLLQFTMGLAHRINLDLALRDAEALKAFAGGSLDAVFAEVAAALTPVTDATLPSP
mmetsp:Transcript_12268/g.40285  ORF Transcript_12268/g.40285 Transcript_12268/m.40285 type:complete len:762 (-) Transcript_12268:302-2587(-)